MSYFGPVPKQGMADRLASRIKAMIREGKFQQGDRLPAIMEMARRFGVGHPTIREALKKLETMGFVQIRHGSGVYVTRSEEVLLVAAPDFSGTVTKKLLLDLLSARELIELQCVRDASRNAAPEHIQELQRILATAGENLHDDNLQHFTNLAFHRQLAIASGNLVFAQVVDVLVELFWDEQRPIIAFAPHERYHEEHLGILDAIIMRDEALGVERMRAHLAGVQDAVQRSEHEPAA